MVLICILMFVNYLRHGCKFALSCNVCIPVLAACCVLVCCDLFFSPARLVSVPTQLCVGKDLLTRSILETLSYDTIIGHLFVVNIVQSLMSKPLRSRVRKVVSVVLNGIPSASTSPLEGVFLPTPIGTRLRVDASWGNRAPWRAGAHKWVAG